jgi:uncharacterized protein YaiE (UPF0345 family)
MADVRINALPEETSPTASENVAIDLSSTRRVTIQRLVDAGAPVASQAEAEAGTNAVKRMTPLTTKQQIDSRIGTGSGQIAAGDDSRIVNAVPNSRTLTGGAGMDPIGDLTINRSIALSAASQASLAKADTSIQPADLSNDVEINKAPKFYDIGGSGIPAINADDRLLIIGNGLAADTHTVEIRRVTDYTTGTSGFLNSALKCRVVVDSGVSGPYENAILAIADVYDTGGQHHAGAFQGNKRNNSAPIWAGVFEAHESLGGANPTTGTVGIEVDIFAASTDSNRNRVGVAILACREAAGATPTVDSAIRIEPKNNDNAEGQFNRAVYLRGIYLEGGFVTKDASFSAAAPAVWMANNQRFTFDTANTRHMRYASGAGIIRLELPGSKTFDFYDTGNFDITGNYLILGTQVLTSRRTGWGAPTGTATRTAFDTTSVTTAQLAERVKALIDDLRTHGLIGT